MLYALDKRYGTCKFVWYSVVHTWGIGTGGAQGARAPPPPIFSKDQKCPFCDEKCPFCTR